MPEALDASGAARRIPLRGGEGRGDRRDEWVDGWVVRGGEGTARQRVGVEIRIEAGRSATSRATRRRDQCTRNHLHSLLSLSSSSLPFEPGQTDPRQKPSPHDRRPDA